MNPVPDPLLGRNGLGGGIKNRLSPYVHGVIVPGKLSDDGDEAFDLITPSLEGICIRESTGSQDKGIEQDELQIRPGKQS